MGILNELIVLCYTSLDVNCPVLTGNMKNHIRFGKVGVDSAEIIISGPSFDRKEWEKSGKFIFTGEYDYAASVNALGAFGGRSKKSKYWANKALINACKIIAEQYDAEVIVDVEH